MIAKKNLVDAIVDFTKLTLKCYHETNYTEDRVAFQRDLVLCSEWLVLALDNSRVKDVPNLILDISSSKTVLDYYKQGVWGDEQAKAFVELQNRMKLV